MEFEEIVDNPPEFVPDPPHVESIDTLQDEMGWTDETLLSLIKDFLSQEANKEFKGELEVWLTDVAHVEQLTDSMDYMDWEEV